MSSIGERLRHGHMVNITKEIMLQGMQADFLQIDRLSQRVIEKARQAKTVRATSKGGTIDRGGDVAAVEVGEDQRPHHTR